MKTSTFGKRRLSRATSDETSYRYRRPSVADVTNDTIIDINNNSSSSNKYVEDGVESGGDHDGSDSGDSSDGSDMEINAWIAKSRKNSLLKNTRITPINIHNIDNSSLKARRTTQLFDMEVESEVAVLNLKIEQSRRREKMAQRMRTRLKEKHDSSTLQDVLASSSDDDIKPNLYNNLNNTNCNNYTSSDDSIDLKDTNKIMNTINNIDNTANHLVDRHKTFVIRNAVKKRTRKKPSSKYRQITSSSIKSITRRSKSRRQIRKKTKTSKTSKSKKLREKFNSTRTGASDSDDNSSFEIDPMRNMNDLGDVNDDDDV